MEGENTENIKSNTKIKEKKNLKPLEEIIRENLSEFKLENVIQIYFSILEQDKEKDIIKNQNLSFPNNLYSINKNIELQLNIFIKILRENYGDKNIIKELYKYIFSKDPKSKKGRNSLKKEHLKVKQKKLANNKNNSFINKKKRRRYESSDIILKIKNNMIIYTKTGLTETILNKDEMANNILGYLYKNTFNNIFFYYPILEQNHFIVNDNTKKILEDKNKILFVCEMYKNEQEADRCKSFGIFDLSKMEFSLFTMHSKDIKEHPHSIEMKNDKKYKNKDEVMKIISQFSKNKIKGALLIKD